MCSLGKSMESFLEQLLRISYRAWNLESSGFQIFKWATDLAIVSAMLIVWVWGIHSCADRYTVVRWVREWGLVGQIWPCRGGFIFGRFFSKYERATNHFETHSSDLVWSLKPRISRIQICVKSDAEIVAVKFHWSFFFGDEYRLYRLLNKYWTWQVCGNIWRWWNLDGGGSLACKITLEYCKFGGSYLWSNITS